MIDRARMQDLLSERLFKQKVPYVNLGRVDSLDLILDSQELIQFSFYRHSAGRYKKVLDIGANIGLHSAMMKSLGWEVKAFEPDPEMFDHLRKIGGIEAINAAVMSEDGDSQFVRVRDNLTASHVAGMKLSYGSKEFISVPVVGCRKLFEWADFAKVDCEGSEVEILTMATEYDVAHLDFMVEIHSKEKAEKIFEHFSHLNVPMWCERLDWRVARSAKDMPTNHREGSVFIARHSPWG